MRSSGIFHISTLTKLKNRSTGDAHSKNEQMHLDVTQKQEYALIRDKYLGFIILAFWQKYKKRLLVISLIVNQCHPAFLTRRCISTPAWTTLGTSEMPNAFWVLRRVLCGRRPGDWCHVGRHADMWSIIRLSCN